MRILKSFFYIFLTFFFVSSYAAEKIDDKKVYPVVIIGGGVGGLSSALYFSRAGHTPVILEGRNPSMITLSDDVKNWPGEKKISGNDLIDKLKNQALENNAIILPMQVESVDFSKAPYILNVKNIYTDEISSIKASCIVIATGQSPRRLNVENEDKLFGRGVSTCALCDGNFYKNKVVAVIGGSDSAILEATYLSNLAKKVYVILRKDDFRPTVDKKRKEILLSKKNIEILKNVNVEKFEIKNDELTHLLLKNNEFSKREKIQVDGVFLAIGSKPNTDIFKGQLEMNKDGYVVVKNGQETSKKRIFVVGDAALFDVKQAILASSGGVMAAIEAQKYLEESIDHLPEEKNHKNPLQHMVLEIESEKDFYELIKNSKLPLLVDFYASWCGPCKKIAPFLNESAQLLNGKVQIVKINVDKMNKLAKKYNIRAMPTLLVLGKEGEILTEKKGTEEIINLINEIKLSKSDDLISELFRK